MGKGARGGKGNSSEKGGKMGKPPKGRKSGGY